MGVCTEKNPVMHDIKPKARLVTRWFEEDNIPDIQKDSPTFSKDILWVILSIKSQKEWNVQSIDNKCAFLQSNFFITGNLC